MGDKLRLWGICQYRVANRYQLLDRLFCLAFEILGFSAIAD